MRRAHRTPKRGGHVTPRWGRERPTAGIGRGLALALALAVVAPGPTATSAAPASRSPKATTVYHKSRNFRIPFNIDPADRPRLKEVQLWVSEDSGSHWEPRSRTTPDRPSFTFRSARDGEYWFAVRTMDSRGQLFPGADEAVEPSMKVVVDTNPPSLVIESDGRRGSFAAVRWEVRDANLDLKSLVLEYQVEGGRDWRTLPIRRPALIGSESWDAGTAEPLKVRASVGDKAGNVTEAFLNLGEGTPTNPGAASHESAEFASPPVAPISSGPTFPAPDEDPRVPAAPTVHDPFPFPPADMLTPSPPATTPADPAPATGNETAPFGGSSAVPSAPAPPASTAPEGGTGQSLLVPGPRFPLKYAVEDAGPGGPATVELWVTQDGGRSWFRKGEDADKASPFPVDLGGEGTFGLRLVARASSGLGDPAPAPGDPPELTVEVDSTPPTVQMLPPVVGAAANLGKVAIRWRAHDVHLGPRPIVLSWKTEQPGARWQPIAEAMENSGAHVWTVPTNLPPRIHLRVDAVDTAGNRGHAETSEGSPVVIDRTRPRSRIIGLDPSARAGFGPAARSLR